MKVLITGGAGYVGYSLVEELLNSKNEVEEILIYDNLSRQNYAFFSSDKFNAKPVKFIKGELLDNHKLEKILKTVDVVYHLAAKVTTPFADHEAHAYDQVNHWGTANLVNLVESCEVKQFVYLSSISVYGRSDETLDENHQPAPHSFYGISKWQGEGHVLGLPSEVKTHIIRSGNVYGYNPAMRIDAVINRFMFEANFNHQISVMGNGEQTRAFIHVKKLGYLLSKLLTNEVPNGIYNAVEHNFSVNQLSEQLQALYPDLEILFVNQNISMRKIMVQTPCKITQHIPLPHREFIDELQEFKNQFSF